MREQGPVFTNAERRYVDERAMSKPSVADWIRYYVENREPTDALFAACEAVDELVRSDPDAAWAFTLELVDAAPDDRVLANVAAGPLEDLLVKWPERLVDRAEAQAGRDPKFCRCLTGVWGLSAPVRDRLGKYTSTVNDPL